VGVRVIRLVCLGGGERGQDPFHLITSGRHAWTSPAGQRRVGVLAGSGSSWWSAEVEMTALERPRCERDRERPRLDLDVVGRLRRGAS